MRHDPDAEAPVLQGLEEEPAVEAHPVVAAVRELVATLLAPSAAEIDAGVVPRSHLEALAKAGVFGVSAPQEAGGSAAPPPVARRVQELLAGADLSTWFVQAQHNAPVRMLAETGRRPELLAELAAGRIVAGIAFSQLRRRPARVLAAEPDGEGWRLDGAAPWYTGWRLNDVALVGALSADDRAVFVLAEPQEGAHLHAGPLVRTAALTAASTVTLTFDGYGVDPDDVVLVQPAQEWASVDALFTANASPAVFGLAESSLRLLAEQGLRRGEDATVEAARSLARELGDVRTRAYQLIDEVPAVEAVEERLALRARGLRLAVDAGGALVAAGAGGAMLLTSPGQRKAREALFMLVQAQTPPVRAATLRTFAGPSPA